MKKVIVKRLAYSMGYGDVKYGSVEYDGSLSDENILGAVHEVGKTQWIGSSLWLMRGNVPLYKITVETFPQYTKSWYDYLLDAIRRL
jgi:hypothetical protein